MIATSHNMVHGALHTIIIHKKEYWNKRVRLTHRGPVNMDIILYITYLNVYLRWDCFILFQVSPRYLKWSLYQHPICGSKYWLGTEQASCHYMKQRWPFWQMHMWVIWPQWVNELSALLKTEYQWSGDMQVVVNWEQPIYTSWTWLTLKDVTTLILTFQTVPKDPIINKPALPQIIYYCLNRCQAIIWTNDGLVWVERPQQVNSMAPGRCGNNSKV